VQQSGNAALATAVTSEIREMRDLVLIDWNNNGLFSHAYSDVSALVSSVSVDRSITGDIPAEVNLIEGYSKAQLNLTLEGTRADNEQPTYKLLNPYQTDSPLWLTDPTGLHIKWSVVVMTSAGEVTLQQFFGTISTCTVKRASQSATITALDTLDDITKPVYLPHWAIDGVTQSSVGRDSLKQNATGLVDYLLRQNGFYCTPPAHPDAIASWTLNGWNVPEVGMPYFTGRNDRGVNPRVCAQWIASNMSWAGYTHYATGQQWGGQVDVTRSGWLNPSGYGANPVTLGMGGWYYGPNGAADNTSPTAAVIAMRFDNTSNYRAGLTLDPSLGPTVTLVSPTGPYSQTWTFSGFAWPAKSWNYIGVALSFSAAGVQCRLNFNGTVTLHPTTAAVYPAVPGSNVAAPQLASYSNLGWPAHSVQVWWSRVAVGSLTWNKDIPSNPLRPNPVLDLSDNYLTHLPDVYGTNSWDVLQAVVQADFSMLISDETGVIRYKKRSTLRLPSTSVRTITTDALKDISTTTAKSNIRNSVNATVQSGQAWNVNIYQESSAAQYDTIAGVIKIYQTPMTDVINVDPSPTWLSGITTIPTGLKAGYWAVDPTSNGGAPPFSNTAFQPFIVAFSYDQRTLQLYVDNSRNATFLRFALQDGSPALLMSGFKLVLDPPTTLSVSDTNSVTRWGTQILEMGQSPWRQDATAVLNLANQIMLDLSANVPNMEQLPVVGDPRLQLIDTVLLSDPNNSDDRLLCTIRGIHRQRTKDGGLTDTLTLRLVAPPGTWILGDSQRSILGSTTRLA